jgi:hypothetical protein
LEQETDGRWIGEIESVPGALAYGETKEEAAVKAAEIAQTALEPTPQEFYEANATNVCNVPRVGHPEDPSGWAGVRRASEARFVAGDALVMTLADAFDFAEKYKADNQDSPLMRLRAKIVSRGSDSPVPK